MTEDLDNNKGEGNCWYRLVERYEKEEKEKLNKEFNDIGYFEREEHHLEMMAEAYDRSQTRGLSLEEAMKEVEAEEEVKDKARLFDTNMILPFPEKEEHHLENSNSENPYWVQPLKVQKDLKHHSDNYTIKEIYEACNRLGTKPVLKQEAFDSKSKYVHKKRIKKPKKPGSLLDNNVLSN